MKKKNEKKENEVLHKNNEKSEDILEKQEVLEKHVKISSLNDIKKKKSQESIGDGEVLNEKENDQSEELLGEESNLELEEKKTGKDENLEPNEGLEDDDVL